MASSLSVANPFDKILIFKTAQRAQDLLLCCQHIEEEEPKRVAAIQLRRFKEWVTEAGVFSSCHASLDYRLRTAPVAKVAIDGKLEILCTHLLSVLAGRPLLREYPNASDEVINKFIQTSQQDVFDFGLKLFARSKPATSFRNSALATTEDTISTLHELALAIQKASNRNSWVTVPKLFDVNPDYVIIKEVRDSGPVIRNIVESTRFETTSSFGNFVRRVIKSRWLKSDEGSILDPFFRGYRNFMLERCVSLISVRRRQLEHFRSHRPKITTQNIVSRHTAPKFQPNQQREITLQPSLSNRYEYDIHRPPSQGPKGVVNSDTVQSTLFGLSSAPNALSSAVSSTSSGLGSTRPFEVPPAPELAPGDKNKTCPYCCLVLPAKAFSAQTKSRAWEKHVLEDLSPYFCLFRSCDQPGKTYRTFEDWQSHFSQPHDEGWYCPVVHPYVAANEDNFSFDTASEVRYHLDLHHPGLDDTSTCSIFNAKGHPAVLPSRCFVCLAKETNLTTLQKHLANHLKLAFLLALSGRDDIKDSDAVTSDRPCSRTALSGTVKLEETDLPDLRSLCGDNSGFRATGNAQKLSPKDFNAQLSTINTEAASAQDEGYFVDTWISKKLAANIYVGTDPPEILGYGENLN